MRNWTLKAGMHPLGRSRGGLTTKIHAIVDALGNPLVLSLTPGQVHDIQQAEPLTAQIEAGAETSGLPEEESRKVPSVNSVKNRTNVPRSLLLVASHWR